MDILIVEDEDALRESLVRGLAASFPSHRTEGVSSVEEALPAIRSSAPRVVVTDVRLPGKDGVELLIDVRAEAPDTAFVMMSAYRSPQAEQHARADGIRLLTKPFDFQELVDAVEECLHGEIAFHGQLGGISLIDLLQILNMGRRTIAVTIERRGTTGRIFLSAGEIVHAEVGKLRGREAFETLIAWRGGTFGTDSSANPSETTMTESFNSLLLDSLRLQDEAEKSGEDLTDADFWGPEAVEELKPEELAVTQKGACDLALGMALLPACASVGRVDLDQGSGEAVLSEGRPASEDEIRELVRVVSHVFESAPLKEWDTAVSGSSCAIQELITISNEWIHVLSRPQAAHRDVFVIACRESAGISTVIPIARRWLRTSGGH